MARILLAFVLLLTCVTEALATHNRAGEITYRHVGGLSYEFTVTTCTRTSSPADREFLEINYGDGTGLDTISRVSVQLLINDAQVNTYIDTYTYAGPGIYTISMLDPNRNDGVININNSVQTPFCVITRLVISPFGGHNNSVQLDAPAKDNACIGARWVHNPGAYDVDGDSLVFSLIDCLGDNCQPIFNYEMPDVAQGSGTFTIDPVTGLVEWDVPMMQGEFNIAILIEEYRDGIFMGSVIRDMQITVIDCPFNPNPPEIIIPDDTCVIAGTFLELDVYSYDADGDGMLIQGFGAPFNVSSPAFMGSTFDIGNTDSAVAQFNWQTVCDHVKASPYATTFRVEDQDPQVSLSDAATMYITVIAPPTPNVTAVPSGNQIEINWDPSPCSNAIGYKVYRRFGFYGYVPSHCETGVPAYTGYLPVGTTTGLNATQFFDNTGLVHGEEYCYMIVACFADGAQSIASEEACARLNLDLPILTNVDVTQTDATNGEIDVMWFNPIELDSIVQWPGPYHYELYQGIGASTPVNLVYTSPQSNDLYLTATDYTDVGLNTASSQYNYKILFYSNNILVGETHTATSVFLTPTSNDNEITLDWTYDVPWINDTFEVYRQYPANTGTFTLIGTTTAQTYTDTGLINFEEYCYYVRSIGSYTDPNIPSPLFNRSQIVCAHPTDLTPPCAPMLAIDGDCEVGENYLTWNNPNNSCADDVVSYNLYYAETDTGDFTLIEQFDNATDTLFIHNNNGSIAGCYFITALDSVNIDFGVANESDSSNVVCIDNCPEYRLPNVFTPNEDGYNDLLVPFPYKYVRDIELVIFNRWGNEIFKTTDPDINWDGKTQDTKELVSDGVYYYECIVYTIRLSGIEPVVLTGYIHVFSGDSNNVE